MGVWEEERQSMLALVQWLFSHTVELDGRGIGTDGRQIPGLLTPYLGFPIIRVHRHRAEDERVKYPQMCSLGPVMGSTGDRGWRGGRGHWETRAEPSLIL